MKLIEALNLLPTDMVLRSRHNQIKTVAEWLDVLQPRRLQEEGFAIYSTPMPEGEWYTTISSYVYGYTSGAHFSGTTDDNLTTEE